MMKLSLRVLVIAFNVILLFIGFSLKRTPMKSMAGYYYFNQATEYLLIQDDYSSGQKQSLILATRIDPLNYQAHKKLGDFYFQEGNYQKAISELNSYIEMVPLDSYSLMQLGDAYEITNQYALAAIEYEKILVIESDNLEVIRKLEGVYKNIGDEEN